MRFVDELKVDRGIIEIVNIKDVDDSSMDLEYWLKRTPQERIEGIESLRQCFYSYDPISERLPRIFEFIEQE